MLLISSLCTFSILLTEKVVVNSLKTDGFISSGLLSYFMDPEDCLVEEEFRSSSKKSDFNSSLLEEGRVPDDARAWD